ncbi:MAG: hypothetical protein NUW02_00125 [Candidatus Campbellbacteria bacterium]|nr:hypothetical protein [Candidatus Campbellbacteria bacterium]
MLSTSSSDFFSKTSSVLPDTLSPTALWIFVAIAVVVWALCAGILWYHWNAYDAKSKRLKRIKRIFFTGSVVILLLAVTFIFSL